MPPTRVLVIGGGIIGGAIAFELAQAGLGVCVLDQQEPGREASWAGAGMLTPSVESPESVPLVPLQMASLALYEEFVARVAHASGRDIGFRRDGAAQIFFGESAERECKEFLRANHAAGLRAEPMSAQDVRQREPLLGPAARCAAWLPDEGWVDNRELTAALLEAAARAGVEIRTHVRVTEIWEHGGRCAGVIAAGESVPADWVIVCAGSFSSLIAGTQPFAPTAPVRGQMLALRAANLSLRHVLKTPRGYVVPRADGRILAGSTLENAGYEKAVTPAGVQQILADAVQLVPALANAPIVEMWSGLRPGTPDQLPCVGPARLPGLLFATGHYRNGILLAPITAQLIRTWILGEKLPLDVSAYDPLRFEQE